MPAVVAEPTVAVWGALCLPVQRISKTGERMKGRRPGIDILARNKRARHEYEILDRLEAGIELRGHEVKSLRAREVSLSDSFARVEEGEVVLYNLHIAPYDKAAPEIQSPTRPRKLLLHRRQIDKVLGKSQQQGFTILPLSIYFNRRGLAKVEIAIARGKKLYDKREAIRKRESERQIQRTLRQRRKTK